MISAYALQQQRGLSRRQVLEFAATQPTFWKAPTVTSEEECRAEKHGGIDWSKYTHDRRYFLDGLEYLKAWATKDWYYVASTFREAAQKIQVAWEKRDTDANDNKTITDPYDKLALDHMLYARLPRLVPGRVAEALLETVCPQEILDALDKEYPLQGIIKKMDRGRMLNMVRLPSKCKTTDDVWLFLCENDSVVVDLFFEQSFREWLFFCDDVLLTPVRVNVPASLWAGKPPRDAFKNLKGKFSDAVITYILVKKMGCTKTDAGRYFDPEAMKKGDEKDAGTYQRATNERLKEITALYTFSFDG